MDEQNTSVETPVPSGNDATLLLRIEEMIKTHLTQIDNLEEEITKHKDIVDDIFGNDEVYKKHEEAAKEATRIKSKTKSEIMKRPDVADKANKLKALKSEKMELQDGLTDYLREYQRLSGSNEIEGNDGEMREIILVPKLVRKSAFRP